MRSVVVAILFILLNMPCFGAVTPEPEASIKDLLPLFIAMGRGDANTVGDLLTDDTEYLHANITYPVSWDLNTNFALTGDPEASVIEYAAIGYSLLDAAIVARHHHLVTTLLRLNARPSRRTLCLALPFAYELADKEPMLREQALRLFKLILITIKQNMGHQICPTINEFNAHPAVSATACDLNTILDYILRIMNTKTEEYIPWLQEIFSAYCFDFKAYNIHPLFAALTNPHMETIATLLYYCDKHTDIIHPLGYTPLEFVVSRKESFIRNLGDIQTDDLIQRLNWTHNPHASFWQCRPHKITPIAIPDTEDHIIVHPALDLPPTLCGYMRNTMAHDEKVAIDGSSGSIDDAVTEFRIPPAPIYRLVPNYIRLKAFASAFFKHKNSAVNAYIDSLSDADYVKPLGCYVSHDFCAALYQYPDNNPKAPDFVRKDDSIRSVIDRHRSKRLKQQHHRRKSSREGTC